MASKRRKLTRFSAKVASSVLDKTIVFSFDRTGYRLHKQRFDPDDLDVDLAGKVCLITGANSGLGRATAFALARLGAEVWLLCRHAGRGRQALDDLRLATGSENAHLSLVNMASRQSILEFVERFGDRPVDVLVHNAGVLPDRLVKTDDGLELTWATNVVGPFLLTSKLLSNLRQASPARVINVSSGGMYAQRLDLGDVEWRERRFDGVDAYAQTKRAAVILTELWAETLLGTGITVNSMHPGWADTPAVRTSLPRFYKVTRRILRTPAEGADTIVWLAACRRIGGETGKFWFDRKSVSTHLLERTREAAEDRRKLWRMCCGQAQIEGAMIASVEGSRGGKELVTETLRETPLDRKDPSLRDSS